MQTLFDTLATRYTCPARCAAALGMSRQAYQQAHRRRHLSESKAMLAAILLEIDPAQALLMNATGKDQITAPVSDPSPDLTAETGISIRNTLYYVNSTSWMKGNPGCLSSPASSAPK